MMAGLILTNAWVIKIVRVAFALREVNNKLMIFVKKMRSLDKNMGQKELVFDNALDLSNGIWANCELEYANLLGEKKKKKRMLDANLIIYLLEIMI